MPPQRNTPTARAVKTERTHEENQERAYIAASRRSDRSIEARVESARRASDIHKKRTGRALRVTEQDVINEDMYEEEDDDLPRQLRNMTSHLQTGSHDFNERLANYLIVHLGGSQAAQDFIKNTAQARPQMLQQPQSMAQRFLVPPSPDEQSAGVQHQMARHAAAIFGHQMPQQQLMNPGMGYMNPMQQGQMGPPQMTRQHQIANTPFNQPQQLQMQHFQQQQQPQFTMPSNMMQQQNQQQHMMQRQNSRQMMQNTPIRGQVTSPPGSNGNFQTQPSSPAMTPQISNNGPRRSISASNTPLPSIEEPNTQPSPPNGPAGATVISPSPPRVATAEPRASVAHMFVPQLDSHGRRPPSNIQMLGVNAGMIMPTQNQYTPNGINSEGPNQDTETTVIDDNYDVDFLSGADFINGSDALTDMFRMGGADAPWGDEMHNSYVTGNDNDPFKLEHNDTMAPPQMNSSDLFISEWTADEYDAAAQ